MTMTMMEMEIDPKSASIPTSRCSKITKLKRCSKFPQLSKFKKPGKICFDCGCSFKSKYNFNYHQKFEHSLDSCQIFFLMIPHRNSYSKFIGGYFVCCRVELGGTNSNTISHMVEIESEVDEDDPHILYPASPCQIDNFESSDSDSDSGSGSDFNPDFGSAHFRVKENGISFKISSADFTTPIRNDLSNLRNRVVRFKAFGIVSEKFTFRNEWDLSSARLIVGAKQINCYNIDKIY
jgi:hypothetical protein